TIDVIDADGSTPMTYAREKGHAAVVGMLGTNGVQEANAIARRVMLTPREAVEKALPLLVRGWQTWSERQSCGACHHRLMIDRVAALAKQRGFAAATPLADEQIQFFVRSSGANESRLREQLSSEEGLLGSAFGIGGDGSSGDALNLN